MEPLCENLSLSIFKEADPAEKDREQIRVVLKNDLEMTEVQSCLQINISSIQSRRFHVMEAAVIVLRRVVSEAFKTGMISDSLGTWMISRPSTKDNSSTECEIDLELS